MASLKINGVEWNLRLTVGNLRRFERRTKVKVFRALTQAWRESGEGEMTPQKTFDIFSRIFPGVEEVAALLYECAVPTDKHYHKPEFDEFCDTLGPRTLVDAFGSIMEAFEEFNPESEEGTTKGPLGS